MIPCETLQKLNENHWVLVQNFFTEKELQHLKAEALRRWQKGEFQPAKVGRSQERQTAAEIRSDWISWMDLNLPEFDFFAQAVSQLQSDLNQNFYLGLQTFECHWARYAEGQFYKEHLDQSPVKSRLHGERVISFVLYLNENWQNGDGGELCLRHQPEEIRIQPRWGELVLFRSNTVPHAVLPSRTERWSLTGWFRRI